jgi:hypothetical protein
MSILGGIVVTSKGKITSKIQLLFEVEHEAPIYGRSASLYRTFVLTASRASLVAQLPG